MHHIATLAAITFLLGIGAGVARAAEAADPFLWLEDVNGERAMSWVKAENAKTTGVLEADPRFASLFADELRIAQAKDRIPAPEMIGDKIYNFWRDADHVRGIWRVTTAADYAGAEPHWTTVLDLDALAKAEKANWVWGGVATCRKPAFDRCLISLSDGGEDATTLREFDMTRGRFVPGGFDLPHSKQTVDWLDDDTLLVGRDWGPGTMTGSGYPFVMKTLKRGQPLADAAEVFRGLPSDVSANSVVVTDEHGHKVVLFLRSLDFFHFETYWLTDHGLVRLALPAKYNIQGLLNGKLIFTTEEDWTFDRPTYKAGSLLAYTPAELVPVADDDGSNADHLIFAAGARQSVEEVAVTKDRVVAAIFDNVRGSLVSFEDQGERGWPATKLPVAPDSSVSLATAIETSDAFYYGVDSYLDPPSLFRADAGTGAAVRIKTLPPRFDSARDSVDQCEATSTDGTKVPYFVVHPKAVKLDGSNPTILYAYGGFQVSLTPAYSGTIGKLWLERGGVYVVANIRGGGEFGPAWHEAALKTHRQLAWDDFAAVAKDLIARGITSPRRLGIQGGSNGGLLMGVEFTQHPELFRAVDIQVPLLDMLRFEQIAAGASWVGEYGSVANPDERAFLEQTSPYANLKAEVDYPMPLIWTTTKDDRVGPQHARKFAAKLASMGKPYLYYEVIEGGHGAGANQEEEARTTALEMTYFAERLMD
ncbi:MAG TPA: prolyl oligopeptidase family serine peptidase [Caulobacteraceae bacterium]|nr:prolyl oligopeptidase family serine peptidase [Caulobacteraceae bacterium]